MFVFIEKICHVSSCEQQENNGLAGWYSEEDGNTLRDVGKMAQNADDAIKAYRILKGMYLTHTHTCTDINVVTRDPINTIFL